MPAGSSSCRTVKELLAFFIFKVGSMNEITNLATISLAELAAVLESTKKQTGRKTPSCNEHRFEVG